MMLPSGLFFCNSIIQRFRGKFHQEGFEITQPVVALERNEGIQGVRFPKNRNTDRKTGRTMCDFLIKETLRERMGFFGIFTGFRPDFFKILRKFRVFSQLTKTKRFFVKNAKNLDFFGIFCENNR